MRKQISPKRQLAEGSLFLAVVCFVVTAALDAQCQTVKAVGQTSVSPSAAATESVRTHFGAVVEAVTAFRPFYVTGDFNGDGAQDIVVVVRIKGRRSALPKDVRVLNPFESRGAIKFPANPASENKLALVIVHDWKTWPPGGRFLLIGEAPILILEYEQRAKSSQPEDRKGLIELMSRRGKRRKGEKLPPASKGDVIILGSEVGDSVLYWNGKTYVWEDSSED